MYDNIELVYMLDVKASAFPPLTIVYLRRRFTFMRRGKTVNPSVWGSHAVAMDTVVSQMAAIHSASPIIPIRSSFPFAHLIDFFLPVWHWIRVQSRKSLFRFFIQFFTPSVSRVLNKNTILFFKHCYKRYILYNYNVIYLR